ncbi:hypothetical protein CN513_17840 [Bacillus cereus]|uniref:glycosyltransferase family 4 protein n=1 Tax=Bacillus cereus TaxID=1396 RepID=UPI000BF9FFDC|nr:glycosyltransferase family 4 protein [Bacillus cereus]MDA2530932.1 glycosyltransferase family 4 protein [Bacillus cereus]PET16271.1 hypothetical protein CN513_17840 [Bacillus cereus]PEV27367.1 hypothetical protein CN430_10830 [Bacillus cereus]PFQ57202.1 hypothetical protein COK24_05840 [Bacillus cereus]
MKKKVLFYESRPEWGGAQKCEMDLYVSLNQEDFDTYFLTSTSGPLIKKIEESGREVNIIPIGKKVNSIRKHNMNLGIIQKIILILSMIPHFYYTAQFIRRNKIDVIYCSQFRSQLLIGWLGKLLRRKVIWHIHGEENLNNFLGKICMFNADKIVVVSKKICLLYQQQFKKYEEKFISIHNGIDSPKVNGKVTGKEDNIIVTQIGSIIDGKRQDLSIRACATLINKGYNIKLHIVGEKPSWVSGEYVESLHKIIKQYGIEDRVIFEGFMQNPGDIIVKSDIIVLPSDTEGFPLSILEAFSLGKPCIATDVGGISEIINEDTGILFTKGNVNSYIDALQQLIDDEEKRKQMSHCAKQRYIQCFTKNKFINKISKVINRV